jgi:hypothetical protein
MLHTRAMTIRVKQTTLIMDKETTNALDRLLEHVSNECSHLTGEAVMESQLLADMLKVNLWFIRNK